MTRSVAAVAGLAVALLLLVPGPVLLRPEGTPSPIAPGPVAVSTGGGSHPSPAVAPTIPIGGRLFTATTRPPAGDSNVVTGLAVDPATGTVFAANEFADTVTEFNESTGALLSEVGVGSFAQGVYPSGLALDAVHHRLFVSVSTEFAGIRTDGWLLILNESGLGPAGNVSLAGGPHTPFEPTFLAYDGPSDQVFVENQTAGDLAIVNLSGTSPRVAFLDCPVTNCAYRGYGLLDVPSYHTLVVPTCALQIWFVNTTNDSTRATVSGPPGSLMAWAAFDPVTPALWVENYSFGGTNGSFLRMNLTTLAIQANVPGAPPRGTQLVYDGADDLLVGTDLSAPEQISTYDASNATPVHAYQSGTGFGNPFLFLVVDPSTRTAIAAGTGNGTTIAFRLPSLSVALVYPSIPSYQPAVAVDPSTGTYFIASEGPNAVRAASEGSGAALWSTPLPSTSFPVALAVDPTTGSLFIADQSAGTVEVLNTSTGAVVGTIAMPGGSPPCAVVYEPSSGAVYATTTGGELLQIDPGTNTVVRTLTPSPPAGCSLAVDPVTGDLVFDSTAPNSISELATSSFSVARTWPVPQLPSTVLVNASGIAAVVDTGGSGLTLLNLSTGAIVGSGTLPGGLTDAYAMDSTDRFLFAASSVFPNVTVVETGGPTPAGVLLFPSVPQSIAFDPVSGVLVVPLANGWVTTEQLVPVPSAPLSPVVTAGNDTLRFNWSAPSSSGADPVDGYVVALHPGPASLPGERNSVTVPGLTVPDLTDGVAYSAQVFAHSAAGLGVLAATVVGIPIGVPYPPTALEVNATGPTSLAVHWSPPVSDDGANVTDYWVYAFPVGGSAATPISAGDSLAANLTGLQPGTSYQVYVTAVNAAGTGQPSASVTVATSPTHPSEFPWLYLALGGVVAAVAAFGLAVLYVRRRDRLRSGPPVPREGTPPRRGPP